MLVDSKMEKIPDSVGKSTSAIAKFIKTNFSTPIDKVRAAYYWTATRISYDVENQFAINFNETKEEKIELTLKSHKGVCINYAEIFNEIATKAGIKSVVIEGYTKQNGKADYVAHAWCGAMINDDWYVFDPTWGSGYVQKNSFVKKLNNAYFMADPTKIIATHMPFDYLWQFLGYPVSHQQFLEGKLLTNKSKPPFDYQLEIEKYENQTYLEKLNATIERIEIGGVKNALIFDRLANKKAEVQVLTNNNNVVAFNEIVNEYNQAIDLYNTFIAYRNAQFKPVYIDTVIKEMIQTPYNKLVHCQDKIATINNIDAANQSAINGLKKSISKALLQSKEQLDFVNQYITKTKSQRKAMLGQRTFFGL